MDDGDTNKQESDLEKKTQSLSKYYLSAAKYLVFPLAFGLGVGASYLGYLSLYQGKTLDYDNLKEILTSWDSWKNVLVNAGITGAGMVTVCAGLLKINNIYRKRKGKEPIKIGKLMKRMVSPKLVGTGHKAHEEWLDCTPVPSATYMGLASSYFKQGKIMEATEAYYQAIREVDNDLISKFPIFGTNSYVSVISENIKRFDKVLRENPDDNMALLELAMCHLMLNNVEKATDLMTRLRKEQDPIAFRIIESRFYSKASERVKRPRVRKLSFGTSKAGMFADKALYFWDNWRKPRPNELRRRADKAAGISVHDIFESVDLENCIESIGDYKVYRIPLKGLIKGFVVLKEGNLEDLKDELENERIFETVVATDRFRAVHPITIEQKCGKDGKIKHYLVQLYEDGTPLANSINPEHYMDAAMFAARSDALMPLSAEDIEGFEPKKHFEARILESELPNYVKEELILRSGFMFRHYKELPVVPDGDWRADGNCLVNSEGQIVALDKAKKGGSISPVTVARVLNQGTVLDDEHKEKICIEGYIRSYQNLVEKNRRIDNPSLVFPVYVTSTLEKAITAWCFNEGKISQQEATQRFLMTSLRHVGVFCQDKKVVGFYSDVERRDCKAVGRIVNEHLLVTTP